MKWRIKDIDEILKDIEINDLDPEFSQFKKMFYKRFYLKKLFAFLIGALMIWLAIYYPGMDKLFMFIAVIFWLSTVDILKNRKEELKYQFLIFKKLDESEVKKMKKIVVSNKKQEKTAWGYALLITFVFSIIVYNTGEELIFLLYFVLFADSILLVQSFYKYIYFENLELDKKKIIISGIILRDYLINRPYGLEKRIGIEE